MKCTVYIYKYSNWILNRFAHWFKIAIQAHKFQFKCSLSISVCNKHKHKYFVYAFNLLIYNHIYSPFLFLYLSRSLSLCLSLDFFSSLYILILFVCKAHSFFDTLAISHNFFLLLLKCYSVNQLKFSIFLVCSSFCFCIIMFGQYATYELR